jgi:hypothetical protein
MAMMWVTSVLLTMLLTMRRARLPLPLAGEGWVGAPSGTPVRRALTEVYGMLSSWRPTTIQ